MTKQPTITITLNRNLIISCLQSMLIRSLHLHSFVLMTIILFENHLDEITLIKSKIDDFFRIKDHCNM